MPILNRDQILSAPDIVKELVSVPEWGGDVYVKGMTGAERDNYEASVVTIRGKHRDFNLSNIRAKLVSASVCDEKGARLFTDADVKALGSKSSAALQRVFEVAQRLSGLTDAAVEELADALKNDQSDGSTSD
jgi:hypothetical protein